MSDPINKEIKIGLLGHPVAQSKSALIHEYWLKQHGLSGTYKLIDAPPEAFTGTVRTLQKQGFNGVNVTVPHKQAALKTCDHISDTARAIGAVNLMTFKDDGKICGDNTDAFGFTENLNAQAPSLNYAESNALIIGAGGAARAALYALIQSGARTITVTNRTPEKATALIADFESLAEQTSLKAVEWGDSPAVLAKTDLIINATSLGMVGKPAMQIDFSALSNGVTAYDLVYNPLMTPFLREAKSRGGKVVTGLGMLLQQARPSFAAWTGIMPEIDEVLESIVED